MGGCMAPAACDTIYRNFCDFDRTPDDYDAIFTGDLGAVGKRILLDLLKEKGYDIESIYQDCGLLIFDGETQDTHSGGSGCGCSASVLAAYILPELAKGTWKKVLFVPTGALLSKTSFNEGDSIPGIAHAVVLEHVSKKIKSSKLNNCAYFLYNCSPISRTVLIIICLYQLSFSVSMRR